MWDFILVIKKKKSDAISGLVTGKHPLGKCRDYCFFGTIFKSLMYQSKLTWYGVSHRGIRLRYPFKSWSFLEWRCGLFSFWDSKWIGCACYICYLLNVQLFLQNKVWVTRLHGHRKCSTIMLDIKSNVKKNKTKMEFLFLSYGIEIFQSCICFSMVSVSVPDLCP